MSDAQPLQILVLGGTAWLGREFAAQALARGHAVWCLARGESGPVADGARLVRGDRRSADAHARLAEREWDVVLDVSWQPGMVAAALEALSPCAGHWIYVSSASVYAPHARLGAGESAELLAPTGRDEVDMELYGAAKVACEAAVRTVRADRGALIARAGLIGGPGDSLDRAGYWVARAARDPRTAMLVPVADGLMTQVIDVRDLCAWLLFGAERRLSGIYDAVGEAVSLEEWIGLSRRLGGHDGAVIRAPGRWLLDHGVEEFMGPGSLPLWIADPDWRGFCARSGAAARAAGLVTRPIADTLSDVLAWERALGLGRDRLAGIGAGREAELIARIADG